MPLPAAHIKPSRTLAIAVVVIAAVLGLVALLQLTPHSPSAAEASAWRHAAALRTPLVAIVIFGAAVLSSLVGFAFSAIAGAAVLHLVPSSVQAVQILMIASIGIQAYSVAGLVRSIRWSRCLPFIFGGLPAVPIGTALLAALPLHTYLVVMGVGLAAYGVYMLLRSPVRIEGSRRATDVLVGAIGGITGPLAAFPGVPVTIWTSMRGWSKLEQRAVYQPYILVMQMAGLGAVSLRRGAPAFDPLQLTYALPALAGAVLGLRVFHALTDRQFERLINAALIASGLLLLMK
jgi:uncharacterized protein